MKLTKLKKLLSMLLMLAMIVGMLPAYQTAAAADETAETTASVTVTSVTVTFSAEDGSTFLVEPMTVTVTDGLAESYGFTVAETDHNDKEITAPTFFDALVAVHKAVYGDAFTPETAGSYITMSGSYLTAAFGRNNAWASVFMINGVTPNDGIFNGDYATGYFCDTAQLQDGDVISFHLMRDTTGWTDYYTFFTDDVESAFTGADVTLSLDGYKAILGTCTQDTINKSTEDICGADISYRKSGDTEWTAAGETDENGDVTFAFPEEGLYDVKASADYDPDEDDYPIMAAWKTVYVATTWQSFGGNQDNMAVTSVATPVETDTVRTKWITDPLAQMMYGMGAPVIKDGAMYFQNDHYLTKLDVETGKILAQTELAQACGYSPSGVAYGDGQIFVAENSTVEAFDAETLERTWIYEDAVGGQACTNAYYRDGYVYTGFYQTDTSYNKLAANYVCIDAAAANGDKKDAVWTYSGSGGFYWAGAYANESYVVFGGEAAAGAEASKVTVLDRATGSLVSEAEVAGNVRSDVSYSEETDKLYFTSDAGYLYEAALSKDGVITLTQTIALGGKSTSTPVVHNGKAYVGVSGANQFGTEGHTVKVVDLENGTINYEVPMNGFPQCTLLLSDAYEEETGKVYLYATENCASGVIKVIVDSEGQKEAEAYDLYVVPDGVKQYCMSSIVCDEDGTLYYSNDTGRIFALTAKALEYTLGDVDDKEGIKAADALEALKIVVKLTVPSDRTIAAADVSGDGKVEAVDALYILKYVVNLIQEFPASKQ